MNIGSRWRFIVNSAWMPAVLLALLWFTFAAVSPQFRRIQTIGQILEHSASNAIVAIGMTFVLLAAGIDLSVGAVMLVASAVAGKLLLAGGSTGLALASMLCVGLGWGIANGVLITRFKMMPFVVTLAMLFVGRGAGLWITQTRPVNLPDRFRLLATGSLAGLPVPIVMLLFSAIVAHLLLTRTPFGRQLYAIGGHGESAQSGRSRDGDSSCRLCPLQRICRHWRCHYIIAIKFGLTESRSRT